MAPLTAAQTINGVEAGQLIALEYLFSISPVYFHSGMVSVRGQEYPEVFGGGPNPYWWRIWPPISPEAQWPPPLSFTPDMLPAAEWDWPDHDKWVERLQAKPGTSAGVPEVAS